MESFNKIADASSPQNNIIQKIEWIPNPEENKEINKKSNAEYSQEWNANDILNDKNTENLCKKLEDISNYIKEHPGTPLEESYKHLMWSIENKLTNTVPRIIKQKNNDSKDSWASVNVINDDPKNISEIAKNMLNDPETKQECDTAEEVIQNYDKLNPEQQKVLWGVLRSVQDTIESLYNQIIDK